VTVWADTANRHLSHAASKFYEKHVASVFVVERRAGTCCFTKAQTNPGIRNESMWEFPWVPWVPWEPHGNVNSYSSFMGMGMGMGMGTGMW